MRRPTLTKALLMVLFAFSATGAVLSAWASPPAYAAPTVSSSATLDPLMVEVLAGPRLTQINFTLTKPFQDDYACTLQEGGQYHCDQEAPHVLFTVKNPNAEPVRVNATVTGWSDYFQTSVSIAQYDAEPGQMANFQIPGCPYSAKNLCPFQPVVVFAWRIRTTVNQQGQEVPLDAPAGVYRFGLRFDACALNGTEPFDSQTIPIVVTVTELPTVSSWFQKFLADPLGTISSTSANFLGGTTNTVAALLAGVLFVGFLAFALRGVGGGAFGKIFGHMPKPKPNPSRIAKVAARGVGGVLKFGAKTARGILKSETVRQLEPRRRPKEDE